MFPTDSGLEFEFSMEKEAIPVQEDPPFKILLLGDYSGRENLVASTDSILPKAKPIEVDRDNFEDLMKRLNTSLRLGLQDNSDGTLLLNFKELDDFHPDNIFKSVSLFSDLRTLRKRLLAPETFDEAAQEIKAWFEVEDGSESDEVLEEGDEDSSSDLDASSGDLLDDILGQKKADASSYKTPLTGSSLLGDFVRDVVAPYLVQTDEAEQAKLLELVDSSIGDLMRTILRHPEFRALETAWRGLYFLVRKAETNSELKISLLDISKDELKTDLQSASDLTDSDIYKTLVTETIQTHGGEPWGLICGNYEFALDVEDTAALIRMAKLGNISTAPFISHIKPQMLGVDSIAEASQERAWKYKDETQAGKLWTMLRTIPEASSLGLVLPRFLGRLPYGGETDPLETFDFEEVTGDIAHEDYVWINPSFACALLLAQSFSEFGWEMSQSFYLDLVGLPTHVYPENGETKTKPCAEVVFTHAACDILIDQGLMPLISYKDTDRVRLGGVHSIAFPAKGLKGRWK